MGQFLDRAVAGYGDPDDRLIIGADLFDDRRIGVFWQPVPDGGDFVPDILCSLFQIRSRNSTVTMEYSSMLREVMALTPLIVFTASSGHP
jgi:hypothetical protein